MSILKKLGWVVGSLIVYLVIFDIIGVVLWFLIDIFDGRGKSLAACYAIWFVMGVFAGFGQYPTGVAKWIATPKDGAVAPPRCKWAGIWVILVSGIVLIALSFVFNRIWWSRGVEFDGFAPDNAGPTLTFFVTILCAMCVARNAGFDEIDVKKS